ncbi:cytochrome P450 [Angustibacter sp. Root456]|uniref:cytochrome P450 n=1 Tax=Angustibacter sp. Root456 TaxID=1736539 RepID=UPI0009E7D4BD|nr:cytochrome P450 [Angustibacter sp. Root456]
MVSLTAPVSRWIGRRLLTRAASSGGVDLSRISVVPKAFKVPFQREGLDPRVRVGARRERPPVSRLMHVFGLNVWLVTGYPEARAVLADTTSYSNDIRPMVASAGSTPVHSIGGLGFTDPPVHTRLRGLLTPEFTKRRLARLQPRIEQIVHHQLDVAQEAGEVSDLVRAFAFPVPFQVICELLGVPLEEREEFRAMGAARFDLSQGGAGLFGAASKSREFLFQVVAEQRAEPGDGLIGALIRDHGDELEDVDLAGLADGVFLGGYETSASMLALGTLVLTQHPEALELARRGGAELDAVVEELLRYLGVVQTAFPRFARYDLELFGHEVRRGDVVLVSLSGANRDERLASGAVRFDPTREPGSHLAFGHGFHRCVGSELARMELRTAFRAIAERFPDVELACSPDDLTFRELSVVYGIESLPVRLRPAQPRSAVDAPSRQQL